MHNAQEADARADVYALGMTALFCIHGKELPITVTRMPEKVIAGLPISDATKEVLARAIELEPDDRFADAHVFCDAWRRATAAFRVWREPVTGMIFVWIPPGCFLMGATKEAGAPGFDPEACEEEAPPHEVVLSQGIWLGEHPVTNAAYGLFRAAVGATEPLHWQQSRFGMPNQAVVGISFEDAVAFCAWLTERVGLQQGHFFDLPTEAEWEHAARGPDGRRYPWGNEAPAPERACYGQPLEIGTAMPGGGRRAGTSPFGCQDMAGNVWEWCLDAWRKNYADPPIDALDPCHDGPRGALRIVRGGSWFDSAGSLRCAFRSGIHPQSRDWFLGFRVVIRRSRQPWRIEP
jgi:serine/threonine-protein kinase